MITANLFVAVFAFIHCTILSLGVEMDCGAGVPLCGTLTLESGLGRSVYHHKKSSVHGLWPEVGHYGTSKCIAPADQTGPSKVYDCYVDHNDTEEHILWFETHEWSKHGVCAGVKDVDDFFGQVCALAKAPVETMEKAKENQIAFNSMAEILKKSGYPVWSVIESSDQIELSACAGSDGRWVLSAVSEMPSKCGGSSPSPSPGPSPPAPGPSPDKGSCTWGKRGPACKSDDQCVSLNGCIRCAHSGYCTAVPLPGPSPPAPGPSPQQGQCMRGQRGPACTSDGQCADLGGCIRCAHSGFCTDVPLLDTTLHV